MPNCSKEANPTGRFDGWVASDRLAGAQTLALARDVGWRGVDFCLGHNTGAEFDDVVPSGHFIGIQLNDHAIDTGIRTGDGWTTLRNPPQAIWIQPAGQQFSIRHHSPSRWAALLIPPAVLDAVFRSAMELDAVRCVKDEVLAHLLCSLVHQMGSCDPALANKRRLSEQLVRSLILALDRYTRPARQKGGLTDFQLRTLREWVERNIEAKLRVEHMAELLQVSRAHFTREFKRSTGLTPWDFVVGLRAERARDMLAEGGAPGEVAAACGFADQAHLCRVIRIRYGVSPTQLRKGAAALTLQ